MYTGIYEIAGQCVGISSLHKQVHQLCCNYVADGTPNVVISTNQAHIDYERERSAAEDALEGREAFNYEDAYLETLAVYRQLANALLDKDILLFHGSVVAVDGVGYLFTAKSGTGKSTHTRLWRQLFGDRAVMINDDKPLIHIGNGGVTVYGTPWNGKHRLGTNTSVPLRAICVLERGEENVIHPANADDIYPLLLQQTYRPSDPVAMVRVLELLDGLIAGVRLYRLACNMDPSAAQVAYDGMAEPSAMTDDKGFA